MFGRKKRPDRTTGQTYFLPRPRDNPPIKALQLGDIIRDPFNPEPAINQRHRVDIPQDLMWEPSVVPETMPSTDDGKDAFSFEVSNETLRSGGLYASYLDAFGAKFEISSDPSFKETYTAKQMKTIRFRPDEKYIEDCFKDSTSKSMLVGPNKQSCLYMIVSLKLAYDATKVVEIAKKRGFKLLAGLDVGAAGGLPGLTVGPKLNLAKGTSSVSRVAGQNFVFAYELVELKLNKETQKVEQSEVSGKMYADPEDSDDEVEDVAVGGKDVDIKQVDARDFPRAKISEILLENEEEVIAIWE